MLLDVDSSKYSRNWGYRFILKDYFSILFKLEKLPTCLIHVFVPLGHRSRSTRRWGMLWNVMARPVFLSIKEQRGWFDIVSYYVLCDGRWVRLLLGSFAHSWYQRISYYWRPNWRIRRATLIDLIPWFSVNDLLSGARSCISSLSLMGSRMPSNICTQYGFHGWNTYRSDMITDKRIQTHYASTCRTVYYLYYIFTIQFKHPCR